MNNFDNLDFIGYLKDYCTRNNIFFIPGPEDYQNAVADYSVYENYDLILCADLSLTPDFNEFGRVSYNGTLALGRKRELTDYEQTVSSLDETFEQKYERRLLALTQALFGLINEIQCNEDGEILSCSMSYAINRFDLNADFVLANINIKF